MKKIIAIVISIIIIITIILIALLITTENKTDDLPNETNFSEEGSVSSTDIGNKHVVEYADNRTNTFTAKRLATGYIYSVSNGQEDELLNMTLNKYIQEENITVNNIIDKVKDANVQYSENYEVLISSMYVVRESMILESYLVNLTYCNLDNNKSYDTKLIVQLDMANLTFTIMPFKYMQKLGYDKLKVGDSCVIEQKQIEKNQNNTYKMKIASKNSTPERYFDIFLDYLKYNTQKSYELLDAQYRQQKFGSVNEYIKYVNDNKLKDITLKAYKVYTYTDYSQYVCIDNKDRYYIFNEKGVMNFTTLLDTYTIDIPEFTEKYTDASDEEKVLLNIQRCFTAINDKDYKYVYNKLDNTFKANNFKTLAEFQTYIDTNFFEKNKISSANNAKKQNGIYLYDIKISDNDEISSITKTFVMQLKEGTDFVMSFGV